MSTILQNFFGDQDRQKKNPHMSHQLIGPNMISLAICYQQLSARINRALAPQQMNMTHMSIMQHLTRFPAQHPTITELANVMEMNQPAVTKAIKAMEILGWIERAQDPMDARSSRVALTIKGKSEMAAAQEACMPLLTEAFAGLDAGEMGQLHELLGKIRAQL